MKHTVPHAIVSARNREVSVTLYTSGKVVIQGKGATDFVTFTLEPIVLQTVTLGYEAELDPDSVAPHMGVDESGKGDYFGPMVIAAAYVDPSLAETMRAMNVRDSKRITSDRKAMEIGEQLRSLLGKRFALVKIGPRAYNRLYSSMRSVNAILAWGHARAIENLLAAIPDCPRAISDQFGSKTQVERALMKQGKRIELIQRHRAESDLAVAAASILAREGFLRGLLEMRKNYNAELPKGASAAVIDAAKTLATAHGPAVLLETAKCHFKTTDTVLGAVGSSRAALGNEGQATSRPYERPPRPE
jgi:ribonuclease HIII